MPDLDPRIILAQRQLPTLADMQDEQQKRQIQEQEVELRRQEILARRDAIIEAAQRRNQVAQPKPLTPKDQMEAYDLRVKQATLVGNLLEGATDDDSYEQAKQGIAQIIGPDYVQHLPQTFDPAVNARLVAQGKALVAQATKPQEAKTREIRVPQADGTERIMIVADTPNQEWTAAAKPLSTTNPTEASLAVAAAKGDTDAAKALHIMRAQRVGAGGGAGGAAPPSAPGAVTLPDVAPGEKNDAYLKSLDAPTQSLVKALAEGRKAFPSGSALRADYWQKMLAAVAKYDPSFDEINYNSRAATRKDFTSGKTADQIRSVNTAIGHLSQLSDAADALHNRDMQTYNSIVNGLMTEFGWTGATDYNTILNRVAPEITRVWRGTGGNESDIQRDIDTMKSSRAGSQIHGAIAELGGMLESQLDSTRERYRQGMGTADIEVLRPDSRETLTKLEKRAGKAPSSTAASVAPMRRPIPSIPGGVAESTDGGKTWKRVQ
jgi:hypothetical protein